jgi:hypothetical protein
MLAGLGGVATDNHKLAIVYGTVVGFIMVSIVTIGESVLDNGLHRTLVSLHLPLLLRHFVTVCSGCDRLCGLAVRLPGCRPRGSGFDSQRG